MSTYGIPLDNAELLGTLLEGILYGFSLLMFGGTIWILLSRRSTHQVNRIMLTVACLLLSCSTVHFIIDIIRIVEALILYRDTYPGGPIKFLSDVSQWTFISKNYVYAIQSLIGDSVILYRCYMVWKSKLVMIVPAIVWCASAVAGIGATAQAPHNTSFGESFVRWITAFYATAFATNLSATVLLAYRIWYVDRRAARLRDHCDQKSQLRKTLHIIIDAGVIYNCALLAVWICFSLRLNGQFVALDVIVPIISITFYMVFIRVGLFSRANRYQPTMAFPLRYTSPGHSLSADRMQVHIPTLTANKVDNDQRSPLSPMTTVDENRQTRSEINLDDAGEIV